MLSRPADQLKYHIVEVCHEERFHLTLLYCSTAGDGGCTGCPSRTDIYLVEIEIVNGSISIVGSPANATKREAYDNQPFSLPNGKSFLYSRCHSTTWPRLSGR